MVRIKDIAKKAQVSTGTVDRVLHNRGRVSTEVQQRVLEIAKELNYQPNLLARALVSKKKYHLAALIPDDTVDNYWLEPRIGIEKAGKELKQYGISIAELTFDPYEVTSFREKAGEISNDYDGILAAPIFYKESLTFLNKWKNQNIPFVLFNTHIPDYEPLSYIGQDSYQSGYLAAKLLHYGHRSPGTFLVAHVNEDVNNSFHLVKKEMGFMDYFEQNTSSGSHQIVKTTLQHCYDKEACSRQLNDILDKYPEIKGIFVTNSRAGTVADYLLSSNISSILLVGYDLLETNLEFLNQGVIDFLINQNPKGQGYYGIRSLADHLLFNKKTQAIKYLPLDIVTKENLQYYLKGNL